MTESKIRDENYYQISGWMLNCLRLKGVALQLYAIIYGFSQDGEGSFSGSVQYLCDFTNATRPTIINALKDLVERGYLLKTESRENGVKFCSYKADLGVVKKLYWGSKEILPGGSKEILPGGSKEILPNNKPSDNKPSDNKEIRVNYQLIADMYNEICISFPRVRSLSEDRKKAIKARRKKYTEEDFKLLFQKAEASSFLKGQNRRNWSATFDWLIQDGNMVKVLDGNYDEKKGAPDYGNGGRDPESNGTGWGSVGIDL